MTNSADKHGDKLQQSETASTRRRLLKLGAAAVPAAITLRGGAAWASSITCQIPLPTGRTIFGRELVENGDQNLTAEEIEHLAQLSEGDPGYSCLQSIGYVVDQSVTQQIEANEKDKKDKKDK